MHARDYPLPRERERERHAIEILRVYQFLQRFCRKGPDLFGANYDMGLQYKQGIYWQKLQELFGLGEELHQRSPTEASQSQPGSSIRRTHLISQDNPARPRSSRKSITKPETCSFGHFWVKPLISLSGSSWHLTKSSVS